MKQKCLYVSACAKICRARKWPERRKKEKWEIEWRKKEEYVSIHTLHRYEIGKSDVAPGNRPSGGRRVFTGNVEAGLPESITRVAVHSSQSPSQVSRDFVLGRISSSIKLGLLGSSAAAAQMKECKCVRGCV